MKKDNCQDKPIFISLSPNVEEDDLRLALNLLVSPKKWKTGNQIGKLEKEFKDFLGTEYTFSFNSGRSAWLAILKSLNFNQGDEILLQAFTCNAAVNPILWNGLKPIFVDIHPKTFNLDPEDLKQKITKRSKAVLVQHTFGLPANLDKIEQICQKNNLILIEDCAHSLAASYKDQKVGTLGKVSFFSLGRDKVISSVYGGLAATDDPVLAERIKEVKRKCNYPSNFWIFQQLVHPVLTKKAIMSLYKFNGLGKILLVALQKAKILSKAVHSKEKTAKRPSYIPQKMPNALANLGLNQLKKLNRFNSHREQIADFYTKSLIDYKIQPHAAGRIYMRYSVLIAPSTGPGQVASTGAGERNAQAPAISTDQILAEARNKKIFLNDGWRMTPVVPPDTDLEKVGYQWGCCPVAEEVAQTIVNLPTHINISLKDAERIVTFLNKVKSS